MHKDASLKELEREREDVICIFSLRITIVSKTQDCWKYFCFTWCRFLLSHIVNTSLILLTSSRETSEKKYSFEKGKPLLFGLRCHRFGCCSFCPLQHLCPVVEFIVATPFVPSSSSVSKMRSFRYLLKGKEKRIVRRL